MKHRSLLFVFGLPGAGKSYVANILREHFGYYAHDGDTDLPLVMRNALYNKETITGVMRQEFTDNMIASVSLLQTKYSALAVHQTLLKTCMREQLTHAFPDAIFFLVVSKDAVREKRYAKRAAFNLGIEYLRKMVTLFDHPETGYYTLENSNDGPESIIRQLNTYLPKI